MSLSLRWFDLDLEILIFGKFLFSVTRSLLVLFYIDGKKSIEVFDRELDLLIKILLFFLMFRLLFPILFFSGISMASFLDSVLFSSTYSLSEVYFLFLFFDTGLYILLASSKILRLCS